MPTPPKESLPSLPRTSPGSSAGASTSDGWISEGSTGASISEGSTSADEPIAYVDLPHVDDSEPLPRDPMAALEKLTQLNGPSATRGANACGAVTLVAALLSTRGYSSLAKLCDALRAELSDDTYNELKSLADDIAHGGEPATYGAVAAFAGVILRRYRGFDGGMAYDKLHHLMSLAGFQPPKFVNDDRIEATIAAAGQRWPAKIAMDVMDEGSEGDHWILVGRDARGLFVYDPYPRADQRQIIRPGELRTSDWKKYAQAIGRDEVGRNTIGFLP